MVRSFAFLIVSLICASTAQAGIYASAFLKIENFKITAGGSDLVSGFSPGLTIKDATAFASLEGFTSVENKTNFTGIDATVASIGTAVADNSFPNPPSSISAPFAFSDTAGSGSIWVGSGATATVQSALGVDAGSPLVGLTTSNAALTEFQFQLTEAKTIRFDFDALLDVQLANALSAPPLLVSANASFVVDISGTGGGAAGFGYSTSEDANFNALTFTGLTLGSPGIVAGPQVNGPFTSGDIFLQAGFYSLSLSQSSQASLSVVPEPTSIAIFSVLGISGFVARRKKALRS
jgi:hypothetical protein